MQTQMSYPGNPSAEVQDVARVLLSVRPNHAHESDAYTQWTDTVYAFAAELAQSHRLTFDRSHFFYICGFIHECGACGGTS